MRSRWRPSPAEERWLEVESRLGAAVPRAIVAERAGGWRSTGLLARTALFLLGLIAAALILGVLGFRDETTLLVAGVIAALAAEWLAVAKRLHASGVEEGLCVGGALMIGVWLTTVIAPRSGFAGGTLETLVLIVAVGAAGLRLLNPLVTSGAVIAFVYWVGATPVARALEPAIGSGVATVVVGCTLAMLALVLGARAYRRPSHDRMLDWLVATLPVAAYARPATWNVYEAAQIPGAGGTVRLAAAALLLVLAVAMLVVGLRRRRHAPLLGFMGCVACLAMELRLATALATETWLILYGLAALVAGWALDRYLREPRNGITSAAVTHREGPLDLLQTAGAAVLAQRTAPELPRSEPPVTPGGGRSGGGGASGSY
ncbi:MAG: hypothetical protein KBB53_15305 [Steroidobacteraceae bacterium]|nr:hypothetical protein [Steroidobacteraceae bacterium]MBP7015191.1 hypothetical protein [Steroidobacteraceae bacterium]